MGWELLERAEPLRNMYGPEWSQRPAIAIHKQGLTLNATARKEYEIDPGDRVAILVDYEHLRIGVKKVLDGETCPEAFKVSVTKVLKPTAVVNCRAIPERFPDRVGFAYFSECTEGRIVTIALSEENLCGKRGA